MMRSHLTTPKPTVLAALITIILGNFAFAQKPLGTVLKSNGNLEADLNDDQWPDDWAGKSEGLTWEQEEENHYFRLTSPQPGKMVMLYQEIEVPADVEAIELSWRQRISGLKTGRQAWFDARILLEFLDSSREKLSPSPSAPASRKDTEGWVERSANFLVPEGARTLKFMPCLFQVESGTFDLDDVTLKSVDPRPIRLAAEEAANKRLAKYEAAAQKRRSKAESLLMETGSLISNGNFESDRKQNSWPDDWGKLKVGGSWPVEEGNHFLRMSSPEPGTMVMAYRLIDLPADIQALELSWRQRITDLERGTSPWFDARIMLEFSGIDGKKLKSKPSPPYTTKNTNGWVERKSEFLVPEGALTLVLMPSLFQVKQGTFDLDDVTLRPIDPAPLYEAAKKREAELQARYVPPETPDQSKWPSEVKVVGNRLHNTLGEEVWLQGVNAGGLETLPHDKQVLKSVVVAIEDWKSNCVRIPMNDAFWFGKSDYQRDGGEEYREIIDQAITLASNRGAYVVIDLHRFRAPKAEHGTFWKDFAERYKNHPAVLFDIFNEPHGISWEVWRNGGWVFDAKGTDESAFLSDEEKRKNGGFESIGMQGLVNAVRSTGAKNLIIAGGVFWCNDLSGIINGYALDDKTGNGVMYSWHTYNWHTGWDEKALQTATHYPIFVGECGADTKKMDFIPADDQEDPYTWVPDMLGVIQKHRLNWTGWCLHPKATPVLISDWSYTPTPYWGEFAKRALSGEKFPIKRLR